MRFYKARLQESSQALNNPGCGWYHIYPFVLHSPGKLCLEETQACIEDISRGEQLVLARIDLGEFRSCELPEDVLEAVCQIFQLFCRNQKQMILRFVYDSEGRGMEREPQSLQLVKRHMEQLGPVICEFSEDILVLQGIFVGSWGEMHHSKFLRTPDLAELLTALDRAAEGTCYLAVRRPEQWREIMAYVGTPPKLKKRLGLFNDGLFGSPTDLGTYREGEREEELAWQDCHVAATPNGGETVAGERLTGFRQAAEELKKLHLCYLNSSYDQRQLDYWKREQVKGPGCWRKLSGYEYIGRHLGSRYVIRCARAVKGALEVVLENRGFSSFHEEAECLLLLERETGEQKVFPMREAPHSYPDPSKWEAGKKIRLRIALDAGQIGPGSSRVYFQMRRKRDGLPLRLANQGSRDKVLLGTLKCK